jgi:hypothetical protein
MSESLKSKTVELFGKHVKEEKKVFVAYEVSGGPPGERITQKMIIGEDENVKLEMNDETKPDIDKMSLISIDPAERKSLLEELATSLDKGKSLLDEPDKVFLPDSVVSSLTIQVEDETLTLHFLTDEFDRKLQNKPIPPELSTVIEKINLKFAGMGK